MALPHPIGVWFASIESGYAAGAPWRAWAERRVDGLPAAPPWLVGLMDAPTAREALEALSEGAGEAQRAGESVWAGSPRLRVGFLWLLHEAGRAALADVLQAAGSAADAANWREPACEDFYMLLSEIDGRGYVDPSPGPGTTTERAAHLFAPFAAEARAAWRSVLDDAAG